MTTWINAQESIWYVGTQTINKKTEVYALQNTIQGQNNTQISFNNTVDRSVSIALDQNSNPWIFWSHFDGKTFSIQYAYWTGINWSPAFNLEQADNRWDTSIEAVFTSEGHIWAAWSWEDGNDDEIVFSYYNGTSWNTKKRIHENNSIPDIDPAIGLDSNQEPVIVWLRYNDNHYRLYYSYHKNSVWSTPALVYKDNNSIENSNPMLYQENGHLKLLFKNQFGIYGSTWTENNFSTPVITSLPSSALEIKSESIPFNIHEILYKTSSNTYYKWRPIHAEPVDISLTTPGLFSHTFGGRDPNSYIAFGDSITEGTGSSDFTGYRVKLADLLITQYGTANIINCGKGGEGTSSGLSRIDNVLREENGLYILIMEGTNDSHGGGTSVAFNIDQMAQEALNQNAIPIVATIIPATADFNDVILLNNANIRDIAEENGYELADIEQAFYNTGDYASLIDDSLFHPNDDGYTIMANTWFAKLVEVKAKHEKEERQLVLNPTSFITDNSNTSYTKTAYQITNISTDTLEFFASLRLPKEAIITKIKAKYYDPSIATNESVTIQLLYYDPSNDSPDNLIATLTSTDSTNDPEKIIASNLDIELENNLYYYFKVSIAPSNFNSLKFYRIEITYEI